MSILGTPSGMKFSDWLVNTSGDSVLNVNNSKYGPKSDYINEKYNKNLRDENQSLQDELDEQPPWGMYFFLGAVVFIIGSILGK